MMNDTSSRTSTAHVANLDDLAVGDMKMAKVGERKIAVIRTASGVHALDNACPHQGYGLVTGALDGELVTCQWHNWKFRADTGECVMGEENVTCHQVDICDGRVEVTVTEPTPDEERERLWPSLLSGIESNYMGQVARDTARLLANNAHLHDIAWVGLHYSFPREEDGPGHAMATAVDCLAWADDRAGSARALPLVQGLAALSEPTRGRAPRPTPDPAQGDLLALVEAEEADAAMAAARHLAGSSTIDETRRMFIEAASKHHLSYGHGIIYTQKAFELLERTGWEHADVVLPQLALATTWGTREDTLPYMSGAVATVRGLDLDALAAVPVDPSWSDPALVDDLLEAIDPPMERAVAALEAGASVERLLDAVTLSVSRRLLRYDLDIELDPDDNFGWLDITHGLTTSRATRWAYRANPGPDTVRQALWAVWLAYDTGRAERRTSVAVEPVIEGQKGDISRLIRLGDVHGTLAAIRAAGPCEAGEALIDASLSDGSGAFIVIAHLIKMVKASIEEAEAIGSDLPLLATGRFLAAPRLERFVTRNVGEALDFVHTGRPPKR